MWLIFAIGSAVFAGITSILTAILLDSGSPSGHDISGSVRGWTHLAFPGSFGTGNRRFLALLFPGVAGWRCKQSCGH